MITLTTPALLWLLVPGLAYVVLVASGSEVEAPAWRRRLSAVLRVVMVTCLVLAAAQPYAAHTVDAKHVLFCLDVSESVPVERVEAALGRIETVARAGDGDTRFALLTCARGRSLSTGWTADDCRPDDGGRRRILYSKEIARLRAAERELEKAPTDETVARIGELAARRRGLEDWKKSFGTDESALASALEYARAVFPPEGRRRIVLFSDGCENVGSVSDGLPALAREGIGVFTVLQRRSADPEVMLTGLDAPAAVRVKEPFDVDVVVESTVHSSGTVTLFVDDYRHQSREVALAPGTARVAFPRLSLDGGLHKLEAVLDVADPSHDTLTQNNRVNGFTSVRGKPRVLYIYGDGPDDEMQSYWIRDALEQEGITFGEDGVRPSSGVPGDLEGFLRFDIVMFENVAATRLSHAQMRLIKQYVQRFGGGFVMIGGEESFGLGGYYRTPVEEILPVRMPVEKMLEKTNMALALVVDKSGSMSGVKIELAKEAAIATAEVLQARDRICVVAFDSDARWIVEMTDASDVAAITGGIASLRAGGGTFIEPAMRMAGRALGDVSARHKLMLVLTDGQTQGDGYASLSSGMAADGITVSTVGIGQGADVRLLAEMAESGGGRFYFTDDFFNLPRIFTQETMRVSKSMLIEEPIQPVVETTHQAIRGIDEFPLVQGYVATTPKAGAKIVLASAEYGDPILATWRFGLGMTAAFTSSTHSKWVPDWQDGAAWPYFTKFWGQVARSVMSAGTHRRVQLDVQSELRGRRASLAIDASTLDGAFVNDFTREGRLFTPRGAPGGTGWPLRHVAPGQYELSFQLERFGAYHRLMIDQPAHALRRVFAFNQPYSNEYRELRERPDVLEELARATGGVAEPTDEQILAFGPPPRQSVPLWHWFLIAALLLLPLDILCKRMLSLD